MPPEAVPSAIPVHEIPLEVHPDAKHGITRLALIAPILAKYATHPEVQAHVTSLQTSSYPGNGRETAVQRWRMLSGCFPVLTPEQTEEHMDTIEQTLANGAPRSNADRITLTKANQTLLLSNMRFIFGYTRRFFGQGMVPAEDLLQEGMAGFQMAICSRKRERGNLLTISSWTMRSAISDAFLQQGRAIYLPDKMVAAARQANAYRREIYATTGQHASEREVAAYLGVSEEDLARIHATGNGVMPSLNFELGDGSGRSTTLGDTIPDEESDPQLRTEAISAQQDVQSLWTSDFRSGLDDLHKLILAARHNMLGQLEGQFADHHFFTTKGERRQLDDIFEALRATHDPSYKAIAKATGMSTAYITKQYERAATIARAYLRREPYPFTYEPTYDDTSFVPNNPHATRHTHPTYMPDPLDTLELNPYEYDPYVDIFGDSDTPLPQFPHNGFDNPGSRF